MVADVYHIRRGTAHSAGRASSGEALDRLGEVLLDVGVLEAHERAQPPL
jgi:hypothetical protein